MIFDTIIDIDKIIDVLNSIQLKWFHYIKYVKTDWKQYFNEEIRKFNSNSYLITYINNLVNILLHSEIINEMDQFLYYHYKDLVSLFYYKK